MKKPKHYQIQIYCLELLEYLGLKFKNENQIEIFESKTTEAGSDVSNNRIYQIYAWN